MPTQAEIVIRNELKAALAESSKFNKQTEEKAEALVQKDEIIRSKD